MQPSEYAAEHGLTVAHAKVIYDMPEAEYHASSGIDQWVTRSMLKTWLESPPGFKSRYVDRDPESQVTRTDAMRLGTYYDVMMCGGAAAFDEQFPVPVYSEVPNHWRTPSGAISSSGKVKLEIAEAIAAGEVFAEIADSRRAWAASLRPDQELRHDGDAEKARWLRSKTEANPLAMHQLNGARFQITIRAVLDNGMKVQVRPDYWNERLACMGDLKTSNKPPRRFLADAVTYGYDVQDVLYSYIASAAGLDVQLYQFIVQQTGYPWDCTVVGLPDEVREWARAKMLRALHGIESKDYGQPQTTTYLPFVEYWLMNQIDDDLSGGLLG